MKHLVMVMRERNSRIARLRVALAARGILLTHLPPHELQRLERVLANSDALLIEAEQVAPEVSQTLERVLLASPTLRILTLGESELGDSWIPPGLTADELSEAVSRHLKPAPQPHGGAVSLHEDSVAILEEGARRQDFIGRLDEEVAHLRHLTDDVGTGRLSGHHLAQATRPVRDVAQRYELDEVVLCLSRLETLAKQASKDPAAFRTGAAAALVALRKCVRAAQLEGPPSALASENDERALTVVVIDDDADYLRQVEHFAEQFMIRVRTATSVDEAVTKVQTPLLAGVILTFRAGASRDELTENIQALQGASDLAHLPLALVSEDPGALDRVQGLWAGASQIAPRPLSAVSFSQIAQRLATSRRAHQSGVLILDPGGAFATLVARHLGDRDMAIHYKPGAETIFEALEHHRPDLLLLSADLDDVSALELCRSLRAVSRWQDLPIVVFADTDTAAQRISAYQAGADDFIAADITRDELTVRLQVRLERARLARERSDRDLLTGLLTRRAFLEQLAARMSEVTRRQRTLVLAILDVDHFKEVNDNHGHPAGDRVLAALGRLLQDRFRIEDLRARWGGEEFVVVLVDEGLETSALALRRVLDEFYAMSFESEIGESFSVSFSAGLACFPADGQDAESLLSVADARLLRAKRDGRRRIEMGRSRRPTPT